MASKTFSLGEDGPKGTCTKVLLLLLMGSVIVAAVIIGIFAFKSSGSNEEGCGSPKLDPNGLSNYSLGADTIVFACLPGYFVDQSTPGNSNVLVSKCNLEKDLWEPQPPTCNFLPLRLDCRVDRHGLQGDISIIQLSLQEPARIFGLVQYENAIKAEGHINEVIPISRHDSNCQVSQVYNITGEIENIEEIASSDNYTLPIRFESRSLAAFRTAEIHISMIFLDINTMATLISVHQGDVTLVMPKPIIPTSTDGTSTSPGVPSTSTSTNTAEVSEVSNSNKTRQTRDVLQERVEDNEDSFF